MYIQNKQELNDVIEYERRMWITRMYPNGAPQKVKSRTLTYMKALRIVEYWGMRSRREKIIGGYMYWKTIYHLLGLITGVAIPPYVFSKGLLIMHLQNIVVSSKVEAGENICLFHNTTLGIKLGHSADEKCPRIGSGVTICAGAGVFGDVTIADGITIGANAVVTKSFLEKNVVVGGIPAKVISENPEWPMFKFIEKL